MRDGTKAIEAEAGAASPRGGAAMRAASAAFAAGIALDVVPFGGVGSAARLAGVAFAVAALYRLLLVPRLRRPPAAVLLLSAFTAWAALSILWAPRAQPAVDRTLSYAQLLLFLWLGWLVVRTRADWRAMAGGFVAGCALGAVGSWIAGLAGASYSGSEWDERYAAFGFDPNEQGVTLALAVPLAVHLALGARGAARAAWLAFVPLAVSATVLTGSRGATVTTVVGLGAALLVARSAGARLTWPLAGLVACGLVVAALWAPSATWLRILTTGRELSGGSLSERLPIWRAGLDVWAAHPVIGIGVGGFPDAVASALGRSVVAHNTLLSVGVELGVLGLVPFLGSFLALAAAAGAPRVERASRDLVLALTATWLVASASLTWDYRKTTWLVVLLAATALALEGPSPEDGG